MRRHDWAGTGDRSGQRWARFLLVVVLTGLVGLVGLPATAEHDVARWSGAGRVETSVEVSRRSFPSAPVAVLAQQDAFADALAAGPMAGALGAPVLLTPGDRLVAAVRDELDRLGVDRVLLMGGTAVLSSDLEADLRARYGSVDRVRGPNRWATAAAAGRLAADAWVADGDPDAGQTIVVALGNHVEQSRAWPDALAAGVAAGNGHHPLLLVEPARVPIETRDAITDLGATRAIVVGGRAAIPDDTADQLGIPWERVSGPDRYATGVALADLAVARGADAGDVTIVTGRSFPDALGAVPSAIARGGVLLLVDGRDLDGSPAARDWLADRGASVRRVTVVGGTGAVAPIVVEQVEDAMHGTAELRLALEPVVDAASPLALRSDASEPGILYVAERSGRVLRVDTTGPGEPRTSTFLDIRSRVGSGGERGLLDLVLHPDFATNRRFFLHHSGTDGRTVLVEHRRSASDPRVAEPDGVVLYETSQPASNHNGGGLAFLPDGTLLLALGDGGGANDQYRTGQDVNSPLASLLRFEVPSYGVARAPSDNPYVGRPGVDELWAKGLRNPFRISVDAPSGTLYVADVGQDAWEEVNAVPWNAADLDYGWSTMEGPDCFMVPACDRSGLTMPVHSYPHGQGGICSVAGGYVHRGSITALRGHYVFGDFCSGDVWTMKVVDGRATEVRSWPELDGGNVLSFGIDAEGEVYLLGSGTVWRIVEA